MGKSRLLPWLLIKPFVIISAEYSDFEDVFSKESTTVLPKHIEINTHTIDLEKGKQPLYGPIYSLEPIELEILKIYIKINIANGFICPSKSPAGTSILFEKSLMEVFAFVLIIEASITSSSRIGIHFHLSVNLSFT